MIIAEDLKVPPMVQNVREVPHWMNFIPVDNTEMEQYQSDPDAKTNHAHLLMYLNSRHWNDKENKQMLISNNMRGGGAKQINSQSRKYNRIIFFADCLKPGRVCCKLLDTHGESLTFFKNMIHSQYGVGWIYVYEE